MLSRLPSAAFRLTLGRGATALSASSAASPSPTPLYLRPLSQSTSSSSLQSFHLWAQSLARSHPDTPHLLRELTWLLQDATSRPKFQSCQLGTPEIPDRVELKVSLEELYDLWRERVEERRPFQYIVGCEHWRDMVLVVREGVLIPRPETEMVVDLVKEVEGFERGWWADLGTGSGALAIGIGRELGEGGKVFATDLSAIAVEVARLNAERYGLEDKVEIMEGSWFEPLRDVKGELAGVVSNPPYIPSSDLPGLQTEVSRHEPWLALDGGVNGMDHLLHLCEGCCSALKSGGFFAFETNGDEQSELLVNLLATKWGVYFCNVKTVKDFAGIKRFVTGFRR